MRRSLVVWALIPPVLWMTLITVGLVTSPMACEEPTMVNIATAVVLALSLLGVARVAVILRHSTDEEVPAFAGKVALLIASLFTAGIALTWVMVGLGPCV